MNEQLKYVPIFRGLQQELEVLKTFDFGESMYPCLEIIKELDRVPPQPKEENLAKPRKAKPEKKFEHVYLPLLENIDAVRVFVDLPVQLKPIRGMKKATLEFLQTVVTVRIKRTEYLNKLSPLAEKIIPVISTFAAVNPEKNSIILQAGDLRPVFPSLAYRTFLGTFTNDILQIKNVIRDSDYLIMDWENNELDIEDGDMADIVEELKKLQCTVITHRNPFPYDLTYAGLAHGEIETKIDNSLLDRYEDFAGSCFSDYAGIKKNTIIEVPIISPGFFYYDATENVFYGYKYKNGSHKKGEVKPHPEEFETTITPAVLSSEATKRMLKHAYGYLTRDNNGYITLRNIERGGAFGEPGKSATKFKRIGLEHYLYCLKLRILNGDFNN